MHLNVTVCCWRNEWDKDEKARFIICYLLCFAFAFAFYYRLSFTARTTYIGSPIIRPFRLLRLDKSCAVI